MTNIEYTPAPWTLGEKRGVWVGPVVMADDGKKGIAFVCGDSNANGRLIASAPDLLAACKEMLESDGLIGNQPSVLKAVNSMRAAIAKAEGSEC